MIRARSTAAGQSGPDPAAKGCACPGAPQDARQVYARTISAAGSFGAARLGCQRATTSSAPPAAYRCVRRAFSVSSRPRAPAAERIPRRCGRRRPWSCARRRGRRGRARRGRLPAAARVPADQVQRRRGALRRRSAAGRRPGAAAGRQRRRLRAEPVTRFQGRGGQLERIVLEQGEPLERAAVSWASACGTLAGAMLDQDLDTTDFDLPVPQQLQHAPAARSDRQGSAPTTAGA
jgi:hypothetical protein